MARQRALPRRCFPGPSMSRILWKTFVLVVASLARRIDLDRLGAFPWLPRGLAVLAVGADIREPCLVVLTTELVVAASVCLTAAGQ